MMRRTERNLDVKETQRVIALREAALLEKPEVVERDKLQRQLWNLAREADSVVHSCERGETVPSNQLESLRAAIREALSSQVSS